MGEARRREDQGLPPRSPKNTNENPLGSFLSRLTKSENKREQFYSITQKGAWIGIGLLILLWITVRFIGPAAGWWIPADAR